MALFPGKTAKELERKRGQVEALLMRGGVVHREDEVWYANLLQDIATRLAELEKEEKE